MRVFRNSFSIEHAFKEIARLALKDTQEEVYQKLFDYIDKKVYQENALRVSNNPSLYDRTYDFLNAIKKSTIIDINSTTLQCEVFIDSEAIIPQAQSYFNAHMSFNGDADFGGRSIGSWLQDWVDEGQRSRILSYSGIGYKDFILDWLDKNYNDIMKKNLRKNGMPIR